MFDNFFRPNRETQKAQNANKKEAVEDRVAEYIDRPKKEEEPEDSFNQEVRVLDRELQGPPVNAKQIADKYVYHGDSMPDGEIEITPRKYPETESIGTARESIEPYHLVRKDSASRQKYENIKARRTSKANDLRKGEFESRKEAMRTREDRKVESSEE